MSKLSPRAEALLRRFAAGDHAAHGQRELRRLREPAALPELTVLLFANDTAAALAAREAAAGTLRITSPRELALLEQQIRLRSRALRHRLRREQVWFDTSEKFYAELPEWRLREVAAEPFGEAAAILGSFHQSGFIRQSALALLAERRDGLEVPALLLRQNDWVPTVRNVAAHALRTRLRFEYVPHLLKSLFLIDQLLVYRRNDLTALHAEVQALLTRPACRPLLLEACSDPDPWVRRAVCQLAVAQPDADVRTVVLRALQSPDLWLRVWAARTARTRLYGKHLVEVLGRAKTDRSAPVRLEALYAFLDDHPELRAVLLDPSASIREMARYYLHKKASIDIAALYRDAVANSSGAALVTALAALSETGGADDATLVLPHLQAQEVRVRRAAVRALGKLAGETHVEELRATLSDAQPGVCREATAALLPRACLLRGADVLTRLQSHPSAWARRRMVALLGKQDRWEGFPLLLAAYADPSELVRNAVISELTRLLREPGYVRPTAAQHGALRVALSTSRSHPLPTALQRELTDLLKLWR